MTDPIDAAKRIIFAYERITEGSDWENEAVLVARALLELQTSFDALVERERNLMALESKATNALKEAKASFEARDRSLQLAKETWAKGQESNYQVSGEWMSIKDIIARCETAETAKAELLAALENSLHQCVCAQEGSSNCDSCKESTATIAKHRAVT